MPVIVNTAAGTSSFAVSAYSPAASNATVGGPAFSAAILLRIVNAMWIIERPVGTGNSTLTIQWVAGLEGPHLQLYLIHRSGLAVMMVSPGRLLFKLAEIILLIP
jgi:hypothetical protein